MAINNSSTAVMELSPTSTNVEAYSVVLSATALVLTLLLGGGGSFCILLALFRSRGVRKYSYTLLLLFFLLCCGVDLAWCPMELAHLLLYHHTLHHPTEDFGVVTLAVYLFLYTGVAVLIAAFCSENVLRLSGCFQTLVCRLWPVVVCVVMLLVSLLMTLAFLYASLNDLREETSSAYLLLDSQSSVARLSILSVMIVLVVVAAVVMMVARAVVMKKTGGVKNSDSYLSAGCNNEPHIQLPSLLLKQAEVAASSEDVVDNVSTSARSINKLSDGTRYDGMPALSLKGRNSPKGGDLADSGMRGPSMLGVNMSQVLGRRRHTICQIGDSGPSSSSSDPAGGPKSKQYNYVRKFSVDISALQAQLSNPKLFKDKAPFQSDQDLTQRQHNNNPKGTEPTRPLLPLGDLTRNVAKEPRGDQPPSESPKADSGTPKPLLRPPQPPVITVSEDVKEEEGEQETEQEEDQVVKATKKGAEEDRWSFKNSVTRPQYSPIINKDDLTGIPKLPITQPVNEEEEDEDEEDGLGKEYGNSHPQPTEDASSDSVHNKPHSLTAKDGDFVKMTLMMALTFLLCTFPLLVVEAVKGNLHVHTYVNVSTCTRALSSVQTIIYPHIVLGMDRVVSGAVKQLKAGLGRVCGGGRTLGCLQLHSDPQHEASTSSQL